MTPVHIFQVNKLGRRINNIESRSRENSLNNSVDLNDLATLMSGPTRIYGSLDEIPHNVSSASAYSTPQKPRMRTQLRSLPSTPSASALQTSPKKTSKSTDEIDNFISNVKMIQKLRAARRLCDEFDSGARKKEDVQHLDLNQVNDMLHSIESQQHELEERLSRNEHEIYKGQADEGEIMKYKTWCAGGDMSSVPDLGFGMRDTMYRNESDKNKISSNQQMPAEESFAKKLHTWQAGDHIESVPDLGMGMRNSMYDAGVQQKLNYNNSLQQSNETRVPVIEETVNR